MATLHDFIVANRDELISRARAKVSARPWLSASADDLRHGVPLFLSQLSETLRRETRAIPYPDSAIGATAAKHGRDLLAKGCTLSQVVHDYGDVCQAITELAVANRVAISPEEFRTLNRCLDTAIAEAVSEHGRLKEEATAHHEVERLGRVAHELRNQTQTALLSYQVLRSGRVGISGSTASVLGRSLLALRDLVDSTLAEVRLAATARRRERVSLLVFVDEIAVAASLHAEYWEVRLTVEPVDPALAIDVDPQLLSSAVMNLLYNAFKYTRADSQVTLRTRARDRRVFLEVEDECGGAEKGVDPLRPVGDRRGTARSGLGLGLSISRKAVRANGGEIHNRNLPGKGCIFAIELPLAPPLDPRA